MKVIAILRVQACINCQLISQDFRCWVTNLFWFRLDNLACCRVRCMFLLSGTGGGSGFTHRNPGEDRIRETEADPAVQPGGQWGHSEDRGPGNRGERQLQSYDFLTCHRLYMYLSIPFVIIIKCWCSPIQVLRESVFDRKWSVVVYCCCHHFMTNDPWILCIVLGGELPKTQGYFHIGLLPLKA